jgi:hypothetical protein
MVFVAMLGVGCKRGEEKGIDAKGEYRILYGKMSNRDFAMPMLRSNCKNFVFLKFEGGGLIKLDGSKNQNLKVDGHPTSLLRSKLKEKYYYLGSKDSPVKNMMGFAMFDFDMPDQELQAAKFKGMKSKVIESPEADKFPGGVITSPGNKYLIYLMTKKSKGLMESKAFDPYQSDSDLIVREIKSGKESKVLEGTYNRSLFTSFMDFSKNGDFAFTVARDGAGFKFIKIELASGKVSDFSEAYPSFSWNKIKWAEWFKKRTAIRSYFAMSPDQTKMLATRYDTRPCAKSCAPCTNHKLKLFDLSQDKIDTISEGEGAIDYMRWKRDGAEFAYALISGGGCYPGYLDSTIFKVDRDGKVKEPLTTEKKSKILGLDWTPDGGEIVYGVYSNDFVGRLKAVGTQNKKVREIINAEQIDGSINKETPITLTFVDWVFKK